MLPPGSPSTTVYSAAFVSPDDTARDLLTDYERGGTALNDSSLGLNVKNWKCAYNKLTGNVQISNVNGGQLSTQFNAAQITEISFTFDQLMRPTFAYVQATVAKLRWFDSVIGATVTDIIPGAVRSPFLALDERRDVLVGDSDMILAYIREGAVYYRMQRERFTEEHLLLATLPPGASRIIALGMARNNRFQVQVETVSDV